MHCFHQTRVCVVFCIVLVKTITSIDSSQPNGIVSLLDIFDVNSEFYEYSYQIDLLSEYDFIIVGAGTAGCVLANRLSEISDWKILLIEAGGQENIIMDVPLLASYLQFSSANWKYKTEPSDQYCSGFKNKQCLWPRGKVLGGSSVLNYMIYTRGSNDDYDNWKAMGNDGWGSEDVLHYFKKVENFNIPLRFEPKYHNKGGYLNVEYSPFRTEIGKAWVKAAQEMGFKYVDYNGAEPSGVSYLQLSLQNGSRYSSNRAYLNPVRSRHNLHILTKTMVTKLIIDNSNAVSGVEIEKNNKRQIILARKEVIVSAGAINSPQLLMLSGIGPKEHLESLDIKVARDLPVGNNLMDHIAMGGLQFTIFSSNYPQEATVNEMELLQNWFSNRESPLSLAGGTEALIFMNHKDKFNTTLRPDVELLFIPGGELADLQNMFGFDDASYAEIYGPLGKSFLVFPMLMQPKSKGKILLRSIDPKIHPKIIPNYFDHEDDLSKIIEGVRTAIQIANQPALKQMGAKMYNNPIKDCLLKGNYSSDAYFSCQARKYTFTIYHLSGTCKMGPENDPTAVVDPRLRVHGVKNLRVIDVSIMPEIVSVHTNAPTYMIAEKGADMIKEDWGKFIN